MLFSVWRNIYCLKWVQTTNYNHTKFSNDPTFTRWLFLVSDYLYVSIVYSGLEQTGFHHQHPQSQLPETNKRVFGCVIISLAGTLNSKSQGGLRLICAMGLFRSASGNRRIDKDVTKCWHKLHKNKTRTEHKWDGALIMLHLIICSQTALVRLHLEFQLKHCTMIRRISRISLDLIKIIGKSTRRW